MEKISLYIAGKKVDLDNNSFILFNYTMEDLSNPTIVKNSFSKQITLKSTPANNAIFGSLFKADRKTLFGDRQTGVQFDPLRKTPFSIYNEMNEVIESGYVKMDSVDKVSGGYEYKVTLFGGLGSFFYSLMYDESGEKKTLNSLRYKDLTGRYVSQYGRISPFDPIDVMRDCWNYLKDMEAWEADPDVGDIYWQNIINFAPCYNGIPSDFSADKFLVKNKIFENISSTKQKSGTTSNLVVLSNSHSEWEMRDLRWYLQRPIISIRALMDAICYAENNGGYEVVLSESFFNKQNTLFYYGWMTLPMILAEDRKDLDDPLRNVLKATSSPAEYLISFAKIFGLVFLSHPGEKKITIMPRHEFYSGYKIIDLSQRISADGIKFSPVLSDSRIYQFGSDVMGAWAEQYEKDFMKPYGIQKVNTGYEFNYDTKVITKDITFKDAVEVQERSLLYYSNPLARDEQGGKLELFYLPRYEQVKLQEWSPGQGGEEEMKEVEIECPYEWKRFPFNEQYPLSDFLPKVQFHDAENKEVNGENVLVVFNGVKNCPYWGAFGVLSYRVTEDLPDMDILNEGVPCWNYTDERTWQITFLPSFRRCFTRQEGDKDIIVESYEWGESNARGVNGVSYDAENPGTIYRRWWRRYMSDRYDVDTRLMQCKVNLSGLPVRQDLMRNFFFFENTIWMLNKISNHSITTDDLTECEFVKVKEINNYIK